MIQIQVEYEEGGGHFKVVLLAREDVTDQERETAVAIQDLIAAIIEPMVESGTVMAPDGTTAPLSPHSRRTHETE